MDAAWATGHGAETSGSGAKVECQREATRHIQKAVGEPFPDLPDQEIVRRKFQCRPIPVTAHQFAIEDVRCIRHDLHYGAPAISLQSV